MITWFEAPKEGLSPGGKLTLKTLEATENKTYQEDGTAYTSVTVNVSGGGSSDFSTAEVTFICTGESYDYVTFYPIPFGEVEGSIDYEYYTGCVIAENGVTTDMFTDGLHVDEGTPQTIKFYIVNNSNIVIHGSNMDTVFTVTGNAEAKTIDYGESTTGTGVVVTGNCTVSAAGHR